VHLSLSSGYEVEQEPLQWLQRRLASMAGANTPPFHVGADMKETAEKTLASWNEIRTYIHPAWVYRGQRSADWLLCTSLERCFQRENVPPEDRVRFESELQRDFRRVYHQYASQIPASTAVMEWASLMQHHGAPTRLLDFTYSIYVAAYFALESADSDCAVWAVNAPWALKESVAVLDEAGTTGGKAFQSPTSEAHEAAAHELLFGGSGVRLALPLTPFRQNERLRTQRGTFLVPGDVSATFMENLHALRDHNQARNAVKIVIPKTVRAGALQDLYSMNISRTSLFPGLDGYAQSLGVFHPSFRPAAWD